MTWVHARTAKHDVRQSQRAHDMALAGLRPSRRTLSALEMLGLYERMMRIRSFEERAWKAASEGEGLPIHPSTGHEAVSVGVCSALSKRDRVVSNHRPFGHFIAKGGRLAPLMAELFGKKNGVCKGLGGEMVLSEPSIGFVISSMIVGACLTIATGVGLSLKLRGLNTIAVCFFGEAASTNGAFNEALTMASLYRAPVLFVCENNGYSTNSPAVEYMPTDIVCDRASGYGFPTVVVDGTDVIAVQREARKAVWSIKQRGGPYFLEALVPRIGPHKQVLVDTRQEDEIMHARMRDPIQRYRSGLMEEGILSRARAASIKKRVLREVQSAVDYARKGETLRDEELPKYLYASPHAER